AMARAGILDLSRRQLHDLSAGQRQRVFVAQGLAQDHDLLLLDEPLSGIDLPTAQAIDTLIHEETGRGCTVILTTHDLAEARAADFVLLLAGKVVASGVPAAVLNNESLRAAYGSVLVHADEAPGLFDDPAHHG
ncbi:MAG: ATP-binding cassette domain-containing protein, partial [Acidimicrobiia bacterium]